MPSIFAAFDDLFRGALPEAAYWGRIALGVGISGLLISGALVLAHVRDRLSLRRGHGNPGNYRPPKWGPLERALGGFFSDPLHFAPLSPDAASEYVTSRIEAENDVTHSIVRYFAYAPLLLGLMGTTFALRSLLVTSGDTLQQIQPQLSGVFAGTLAGIGGSLLAALGGLVLDRVALSTSNKAQDFVHSFIIPSLPERRIAIRIEDAVLSAISERAQAVVEHFRSAIQPVVTELQIVAERCGEAAGVATNAFSEAARAVKEAGNLETASRSFKASAHMIDSSAEQLSDVMKQTAEVVLRAGEVRGSLKALLDRIQTTSEALGSSNERVASQLEAQLATLNEQLVRIERSSTSLAAATETLATELTRRANRDSEHMEAAKNAAEATARQVADLKELTTSSAADIKQFRSAIVTVVAQTDKLKELNPLIGNSVERTESAVQSLQDLVNQKATIRAHGSAGADGVDTNGHLLEAVEELRSVSESAKRLIAEMTDLKSEPRIPPRGFFRWPWH